MNHDPFKINEAILDMWRDLKAGDDYIERLEVRNAELVSENARLKAEVESLKKPATIGGYNISEYIRMANSETLEFDNGDIFADMTLPERIKYIVESHARLKAEVEMWKLRSDNWQKFCQISKEGKPSV